MQKQGNTSQPNQAGKPAAGTISGMLADFSRALGKTIDWSKYQ